MAILPAHPSIKISIVCNGVALPEYDDNDQESQNDVISKYIEATSGAEFGILCELSSPWPPYTVHLTYFLDQKRACSKLIRSVKNSSSSKYKPSYTKLVEGLTTASNGQTYLHKFVFAALNIDESAAVPVRSQLMQNIKGMGEITVTAKFVKNLRYTDATRRAPKGDFTALGTVPEQALKGSSVSHQASLRAAQPKGSRRFRVRHYTHVDSSKGPFATYNFKYRSRDSLKALLIIPRSTSPVPLEERDVDSLSMEEMRELLRRQRVCAPVLNHRGDTNTTKDREAVARAAKLERGIKRERPCERNTTLLADADDTDEDDDLIVVASKRRRDSDRNALNEHGVEVLDLT
ncbi:hypothetical protein SVAN01_08257 [Stagonosporopsis vannaccii]|nr:hypothetical protein SVAN01_08257 [Stagonosporopsis vannaccii]